MLTNDATRARSPTADLPTTAAFLGGLVAQEVIKMITKQYVPITGYCVVDLITSKILVLRE
jgi:amyloid beta precursor protein binding protein 1